MSVVIQKKPLVELGGPDATRAGSRPGSEIWSIPLTAWSGAVRLEDAFVRDGSCVADEERRRLAAHDRTELLG